MMAVAQIGIRLLPEMKSAFDAYAGRLGLASSELAKLLIVRERYRRKLSTLRNEPNHSTKTGGARTLPKITAHVSSVEEVAEFDSYARENGLDRNGAGVLLLRAELRERWLEHAITTL